MGSLFKSIINSRISPEMHNVGIISVMHYHPIVKNMRFHKERDEERKLEGRRVERRERRVEKGEGGGERSEEERLRIYPVMIDGQDELKGVQIGP